MKKKWIKKIYDKKTASELSRKCGTSLLTAAVLASRGYSSAESVINDLNSQELSDPFLIKDMKKAAGLINEAINSGTRICIYGDYDCDGIMATVILYTFLYENGADVTYYIPERSEGYGLNKDAVTAISESGTELIITVDNGISALKEAELIYSLGMKLIITDHHQQGEELPKAEAIVDPHRHDDISPFKFSCGAVIALKLIAALDGGDYTAALEQFGDLAAIATVADIVSLTGENRFIVSYGLELINNTDRPALIALKEVSGLNNKKTNSQAIGFGLAPRINAAGRFASPQIAVDLFLCEDLDKALEIARKMNDLNTARKTAENTIISEIYDIINSDDSILRDRAICIFGKNWNHGIIGIVASRITERFGKPCFIASEENGEIRGSARSFGSFSVFSALTAASDSLEKFGGHPSAGGFTIKPGMENEFRRLINKYAFENNKVMPLSELVADVTVSASDLTVSNAESLNVLQPFGMGNEKPSFLIENAEIVSIIPLSGGVHSKLNFKLENSYFDAVMFRKSPQDLPVGAGEKCSMIVNLDTNLFKSNLSLSIIISDIRQSNFDQKKYFSANNAFEAFMRGEELPQNYFKAMLPSRDDAVKVYTLIPYDGISVDSVYSKLNDTNINFCRMSVALEAMKQLGLITHTYSDSIVRRVRVNRKTDLDSAPILISIRDKIVKNQ